MPRMWRLSVRHVAPIRGGLAGALPVPPLGLNMVFCFAPGPAEYRRLADPATHSPESGSLHCRQSVAVGALELPSFSHSFTLPFCEDNSGACFPSSCGRFLGSPASHPRPTAMEDGLSAAVPRFCGTWHLCRAVCIGVPRCVQMHRWPVIHRFWMTYKRQSKSDCGRKQLGRTCHIRMAGEEGASAAGRLHRLHGADALLSLKSDHCNPQCAAFFGSCLAEPS